MLTVHITNHAIERYQSRVDPRASRDQARLVLGRMVCLGRARSTPRHWMRHVNKTPGLVYLYWAELPGVCGLVLNGALITVLTRELCKSEPRHLRLVPTDSPTPQPRFAERRLRLAEAPKDAA